ncbi:MAG: hypothetical protein NTV11_03185 [Rhodocyclales bacterium]|nr:hypothetical protein [Rhodocyclales bacterium]
MRLLFLGILCAALLASARADDTPATGTAAETRPALVANPTRLGYAFEQPEILIRQRLFGLAHGMSLLAASCLDLPEHSKPIQDAYATWHARQGKAIEALAQDLALYYFGPRAPEAQWQDLARAMNLNDSIQPSLGEVSLQDACASLPEAITRPRYELDKLLAEAAAPLTGPVAAPANPPAVPASAAVEPPTPAQ